MADARPAPRRPGSVRPRPELNENRAGPKPRPAPRGWPANTRRSSSQMPRNVAGTVRGVRPMGDWSTASTRRSGPIPERRRNGPGGGVVRPSASRTAGNSTRRTSVLLPEPETPATTVIRPSGSARSTPRRLWHARALEPEPVTRRRAAPAAAPGPGAGAPVRWARPRWRAPPPACPARHDAAAEPSAAGAEVDEVVRGAERVEVVLHHQHRAPGVDQRAQVLQQPPGVARVQADGRLVEHVERAGESGARPGPRAGAAASPRRSASPRHGRARGSRGPTRSRNSSRRISSPSAAPPMRAASPDERPAPDFREGPHHGLLHHLGVAAAEEPDRAGDRLQPRALAGGARVGRLALDARPPSSPVPSQSSHRPCAVLKENQRGSSSGTAVPQRGQLRSEESSRLAARAQHLHRAPGPSASACSERLGRDVARRARTRPRGRWCARGLARSFGGASVDDPSPVADGLASPRRGRRR